MRLLRHCEPQTETGAALSVLLFGTGLIGGAVDQALRLRTAFEAQTIGYDWNASERRIQQRQEIRTAIAPGSRVALVWAGGNGGFGSTDAAMQAETALVEELIRFAEDLRQDHAVDFHLISSAGGLFEGQKHCTGSSRPEPLRPYGTGKLAQEGRLAASDLERWHIYRPSSVYGISSTSRIGLVSMLVSNALLNRTTRISGNPNTLRDYVLAEDIGSFLARRIVSGGGTAQSTEFVASGRPVSIHEMIALVREQIGPLFLQFDPRPQNARDMSFLMSALPEGWQATSLQSGLARVALSLRKKPA